MTFDVCVMDPPWPERGGGKVKRGADRHYAVRNTADLASVILDSGVFMAAPDALLWMWATETYLEPAMSLMRRLGFRKCTGLVWAKCNPNGTVPPRRMGLGQWVRMEHEHLLLGRRGTVRVPEMKHRSVVYAHRGRHSEKPEAAWRVIEDTSHQAFGGAPLERLPLRCLEMFARRSRPGWSAWGDEV